MEPTKGYYDINDLNDTCILYECKGWASKVDIVIINKFGVQKIYAHDVYGITKACNEICNGFWLEAPRRELNGQ